MCAKRRATARLIRSDDWLEIRQLAACKAVGAAASGAELNLFVKKLFQPRLTAQVRTSGLAEQAPFTNHVISAARAAV